MRHSQNLLFIGIWTMVLPFLGVPQSWKAVFLVLTGVLIIIEYLRERNIIKSHVSKEARPMDDVYVEHNAQANSGMNS